MAKLLACPFCREIFTDGEAAQCQHCGIGLLPMDKLPPSWEALQEEAARGETTPPEYRTLPWTYLGRGRGALLVLALLGLAAFFSPWVEFTSPSEAQLSGYDMAHSRAGWLWGGAVGWFLMLPLIATRRSVLQLRGVRIITATFSLMTLAETGMLLAMSPAQSPYVRIHYHYAWGLYASGSISVLATLVAARLGGRLDDLRDLSKVLLMPETTTGQPLH